MDWNLFITFCILNVVNVIIQTIKSLCTMKCGKYIAAGINALAYGLYTVVVIYMVCDIPLWLKVSVIALANLIGVFVVKLIEEKSRKEKLWKVEGTIAKENSPRDAVLNLKYNKIPCNFIDIETHYIINAYCADKSASEKAKKIFDTYKAKYFVAESKVL